ncbi:myosin-2 heavy chain-like isoform X2 [Rhopilema esculentum]|uniref:myosin-2 heavy chain-like isoform X2 n=1 Tax=Rhopilema esculentum TaxID=499914 RepID=UPI0031CF07D2
MTDETLDNNGSLQNTTKAPVYNDDECDQEVSKITNGIDNIGCRVGDKKSKDVLESSNQAIIMMEANVKQDGDNEIGQREQMSCQSCQDTQEKWESYKISTEANFSLLKEKLMNTSELIKAYKQKCLECDSLSKENQSMGEKLKKCYSENGALRVQLEKAKQANEPLKKAATRFENEKKYSEARIEDLTEQLKTKQSHVDNLEDALIDKVAMSTSINASSKKFEKENASLTTKLEKKEKEIEKLKTQVKTAKTARREADKRTKDAKKQIEKMTQQIKNFQDKLNGIKESPKKGQRQRKGIKSQKTSIRFVKSCTGTQKREDDSPNVEISNLENDTEISTNDVLIADDTQDDEVAEILCNVVHKPPGNSDSFKDSFVPEFAIPSPPLSPIPPSPAPIRNRTKGAVQIQRGMQKKRAKLNFSKSESTVSNPSRSLSPNICKSGAVSVPRNNNKHRKRKFIDRQYSSDVDDDLNEDVPFENVSVLKRSSSEPALNALAKTVAGSFDITLERTTFILKGERDGSSNNEETECSLTGQDDLVFSNSNEDNSGNISDGATCRLTDDLLGTISSDEEDIHDSNGDELNGYDGNLCKDPRSPNISKEQSTPSVIGDANCSIVPGTNEEASDVNLEETTRNSADFSNSFLVANLTARTGGTAFYNLSAESVQDTVIQQCEEKDTSTSLKQDTLKEDCGQDQVHNETRTEDYNVSDVGPPVNSEVCENLGGHSSADPDRNAVKSSNESVKTDTCEFPGNHEVLSSEERAVFTKIHGSTHDSQTAEDENENEIKESKDEKGRSNSSENKKDSDGKHLDDFRKSHNKRSIESLGICQEAPSVSSKKSRFTEGKKEEIEQEIVDSQRSATKTSGTSSEENLEKSVDIISAKTTTFQNVSISNHSASESVAKKPNLTSAESVDMSVKSKQNLVSTEFDLKRCQAPAYIDNSSHLKTAVTTDEGHVTVKSERKDLKLLTKEDFVVSEHSNTVQCVSKTKERKLVSTPPSEEKSQNLCSLNQEKDNFLFENHVLSEIESSFDSKKLLKTKSSEALKVENSFRQSVKTSLEGQSQSGAVCVDLNLQKETNGKSSSGSEEPGSTLINRLLQSSDNGVSTASGDNDIKEQSSGPLAQAISSSQSTAIKMTSSDNVADLGQQEIEMEISIASIMAEETASFPRLSPLPPSPPCQQLPMLSPLPITPLPDLVSPLLSPPKLASPSLMHGISLVSSASQLSMLAKPQAMLPFNSKRTLDFTLKTDGSAKKKLVNGIKNGSVPPEPALAEIAAEVKNDSVNEKIELLAGRSANTSLLQEVSGHSAKIGSDKNGTVAEGKAGCRVSLFADTKSILSFDANFDGSVEKGTEGDKEQRFVDTEKSLRKEIQEPCSRRSKRKVEENSDELHGRSLRSKKGSQPSMIGEKKVDEERICNNFDTFEEDASSRGCAPNRRKGQSKPESKRILRSTVQGKKVKDNPFANKVNTGIGNRGKKYTGNNARICQGDAQQNVKSEVNDMGDINRDIESKESSLKSALCIPTSCPSDYDLVNNDKVDSNVAEKSLPTRGVRQSEVEYAQFCLACLKNNATPKEVVQRFSSFKNVSSATSIVSAIIAFLKLEGQENLLPAYQRLGCVDDSGQFEVESIKMQPRQNETSNHVESFSNLPVLTEMEQLILRVVADCMKIPHLNNILKLLLQRLPKSILGESNTRKEGMLSLSRLMTALSCGNQNVDGYKDFLYNVTWSKALSEIHGAILISCFCVWPKLFSSANDPLEILERRDRFGTQSILFSTQVIACYKASENKDSLTYKALQKILPWSSTKHDLLDSLCDVLMDLLESDHLQNDCLSTDSNEFFGPAVNDIKRSFLLLAKHKGWIWCNNTLIREYLWNIFRRWSQQFSAKSNAVEKKVSDATIATSIRIIGEVSQLGLEEGYEDFGIIVRMCTGILSRSKILAAIPKIVQIASAYTLLDIVSTDRESITAQLTSWLAQTKCGIPFELEQKIHSLQVQKDF